MTEVIARVHSVHLVNVEQRQAAADPQTKPLDMTWAVSPPVIGVWVNTTSALSALSLSATN